MRDPTVVTEPGDVLELSEAWTLGYQEGHRAAFVSALLLVDGAIFDLPIGNDVTYSRGYSSGIGAARESFREALRAALASRQVP